MASTVQQVINKFLRKYPEVDSASCKSLFDDAHRRILSRIQLRNDVQIISLVYNVREYPLSADVMKIHSAYYQQDGGNQYPLEERSTDELDVMRWGWRVQNYVGEPIDYYVSATVSGNTGSAVVGFDPIPATTSDVTSTYPRIALYCTTHVDLLLTDTVPSNLLTDNYYIYEMWANWALIANPADSAYWSNLSEIELNRNHEHVTAMQASGSEGFFPTSAYMPTRIW